MHFSLLDLWRNDTCDGMNFTYLTYLTLLHYLVKIKTVENVQLQSDIAKENCIKCIVYASTKWTCTL